MSPARRNAAAGRSARYRQPKTAAPDNAIMLALPPRTSGAVVGAIMRASKIEEDAVNTTLGTANEVLRTAQNSFRLLFSAADTLITGKRQREHVLERFYVRKDESWADSVPLAA